MMNCMADNPYQSPKSLEEVEERPKKPPETSRSTLHFFIVLIIAGLVTALFFWIMDLIV